MSKEKIESVISLLKKEFKGVKPKASKSDPLDILIATMLSQNTTDKTSYIAFQNLKKDFKNWHEVMNASLNKIEKSIRVCGLANQKSKSIKYLLQGLKKKRDKLSMKYLNEMSNDKIYEELLEFNGIGLKTISCVLAFGLGRDVFPVDTHVHRLCNRLGIANTKSPDKTFEQVKRMIPKGKKFLLHTMLIRFGRKVCRARNPLCGECILYDLCEFREKENYAIEKNLNKPKENNFIILEHV